MAIDPFGTVDELLQFLQLPQHNLIEKFIEQHTSKVRSRSILVDDYVPNNSELEKVMQEKFKAHGSIKKYSTARAFLWRRTLKKKNIAEIQKKCEKPMRTLGYTPMLNIAKNIK